MKKHFSTNLRIILIAVAGLLFCLPLTLSAAERRAVAAGSAGDPVQTDAEGGARARTEVAPQDVEAVNEEESDSRTDFAYLGIATTEISEALSAQLDLKAGVGLVATYVAPESPAAKAGLQKNDVLVEFEDQSLVHPGQLRKLVRVRKEGDVAKLVFYHAGKQQTASVTLAKAPAKFGSLGQERALRDKLEELERRLEDRGVNANVDEAVHEALRHLSTDRKGLHQEIHRRMEEVRTAIQEALRDVTNVASNLDPVRNILRDLNRSGVHVDKNATVTVRSDSKKIKSVVKADDSGTIVLVQNPKIHLTAHDKEGHLLFDGEIETAEQRDKIPRDLWERVEPLMEKMRD
jgi:hypothetical protein